MCIWYFCCHSLVLFMESLNEEIQAQSPIAQSNVFNTEVIVISTGIGVKRITYLWAIWKEDRHTPYNSKNYNCARHSTTEFYLRQRISMWQREICKERPYRYNNTYHKYSNFITGVLRGRVERKKVTQQGLLVSRVTKVGCVTTCDVIERPTYHDVDTMSLKGTESHRLLYIQL